MNSCSMACQKMRILAQAEGICLTTLPSLPSESNRFHHARAITPYTPWVLPEGLSITEPKASLFVPRASLRYLKVIASRLLTVPLEKNYRCYLLFKTTATAFRYRLVNKLPILAW